MPSANMHKVAKEVKACRTRLGLGLRPARELFDACERGDVLVFRMSLPDNVSGAFVRSKRHKLDVIVVNTLRKCVHHQRFTLAHELGHLALHESKDGLVESLPDRAEDRPGSEREADTFAAALLVPLKEIRRILHYELRVSPMECDDRLVIGLAEKFGVSHHVILRRLRALDRDKLKFDWVRERAEGTDWNAMWRQYAPASHPDTIPTDTVIPSWHPEGVSDETAVAVSRFPDNYREMAFEAYRRGKITGAKLAEILGLAGKEVVIRDLAPILKPELVAEHKELERALREGAGEE